MFILLEKILAKDENPDIVSKYESKKSEYHLTKKVNDR